MRANNPSRTGTERGKSSEINPSGRITRKKAIGQIVGFLVVENGLFVTAMFATHGMPIVVDLGIFIDIITAVLIMGVMVSRIDESFATTDIDKLRRLRG
jgi:hydrogenase-4 component E